MMYKSIASCKLGFIIIREITRQLHTHPKQGMFNSIVHVAKLWNLLPPHLIDLSLSYTTFTQVSHSNFLLESLSNLFQFG